MKYISFILVFFSSCFLGQNYQFLYDYKYAPDSTKTDSLVTEVMRLSVVGKNSHYLSNKMAISDSLSKLYNESTEPPSIIQQVFKKGNVISIYEEVYQLNFKITDNFTIPWKLESEKKKIEKWECQKATANFGGRIWTAWFTTEIPLQEGPYYFKGLPGQIVSLDDSKKHYQFQLISVQNIKKAEELTVPQPRRVINLDSKGFTKYWQNYRKEPLGWLEQMAQVGFVITGMQDGNGREEDINLAKIKQRKHAQDWVKRNNNFIDLKLYE